MCPTGAEWDAAVASWRELKSDEGAKYDRVVEIAAADIAPTVTWGTSPQDVTSIEGTVPIPDDPARGGSADPARQAGIKRSLEYMGLEGGERMQDLKVDKVRRHRRRRRCCRRCVVAVHAARFLARPPARPAPSCLTGVEPSGRWSDVHVSRRGGGDGMRPACRGQWNDPRA